MAASIKYLVYGLVDPRSNELRYVGKTCTPLSRRLKQHVWEACSGRKNTHRHNWLRQLLADGLRPRVEVLNSCSSAEELNESERFYIAFWRMAGVHLTNWTEGGEGGATRIGRKNTSQWRAKMSTALRGRKVTWGVQISRSLGGRPFVDQYGTPYETQYEAARKLGLHRTAINRVLHGNRRSTGGYEFKFLE